MDMIFGKLGWDSIPTEPIVLVTMVMMALGGIAVLGGITYFKKWGYLWLGKGDKRQVVLHPVRGTRQGEK